MTTPVLLKRAGYDASPLYSFREIVGGLSILIRGSGHFNQYGQTTLNSML
jgi:hypothetical protein